MFLIIDPKCMNCGIYIFYKVPAEREHIKEEFLTRLYQVYNDFYLNEKFGMYVKFHSISVFTTLNNKTQSFRYSPKDIRNYVQMMYEFENEGWDLLKKVFAFFSEEKVI